MTDEHRPKSSAAAREPAPTIGLTARIARGRRLRKNAAFTFVEPSTAPAGTVRGAGRTKPTEYTIITGVLPEDAVAVPEGVDYTIIRGGLAEGVGIPKPVAITAQERASLLDLKDEILRMDLDD